MRLTKALAVALFAVLVLTFVAVVPAPARAQPTAGASHPSAGTATITPTDEGGFFDSNYQTGFSNGRVYFSAFDNGGDASAVVAIHDQNHTRDNLADPVVSWTVSFTASNFNNSYTYGVFYLIPYSLTYGGWWNITITATSAGFSSTSFYVDTYAVTLRAAQSAYTPLATASVYYLIYSTVNLTPYPFANTLWFSATYETNAFNFLEVPGTPTTLPVSGASGTFNVTVPVNAYGYSTIDIAAFANTSNGNFEQGFTSFAVGYLGSPSVTLSSCALPCTSSGFYLVNTPIFVLVQEMIISPYGDFPAIGDPVAFTFHNNRAQVFPTGAPSGSVSTNGSGEVGILFWANSSQFTTTNWNSVNVTVTDALNSSLHLYDNVTFYVSNPYNVPYVTLSLDQAQYYSGDTVTGNWAIGGAGNVATGWTAAWWLAYAWTTGNVLGVGTITSGGTSGSFAFALPSGYTGRIFVQVEVHNQTQVSGAYSYATVLPPALTVTPSELFYLPGDTITLSVSTQGQVFQGSTLYELVTNANSQQVSNGSIGGGSFQIHVPSIDASGSYGVSVWAVATDGSVIASSLTSLSEFIGLTLHVGVQTPSSYADGSYQPGQALQLSYSLAPSGPVSAPRTFLLEIAPGFLFFGGGPGSVADQVNGASGSVGYSVPSNIGSGAQMFTVFAVIPGCVPTCSVVTSFSILVNSHPSVFSMEVPAGSGLTVGWIVLLVLIVLVAVALFVGLRRRGRPMVLRPESHATAPAASPAPAAWSEPATPSSSGGPPPGAQ